ncbi:MULTISPECIES: GcrA family cell cycle regulator [Brevundimonas]|uniref:GcrA family cell cycle regulator n=1 Tax=Brevundimonas sp. TaxID=1871086 RepID=UPI0025BD207E|nr:GcrA family cell cycle regulator [Brevundimonas sp.]MCG2662800.1 GcrA family cell cycle regulator [Brevundimonas sp.]
MTVTIWTEERILRLTALWLEGRTAAAIARELGRGVSRCAVLGKVYRLGLARGPEARRVRPAAPPRTKRRREVVVAPRPAGRPSGPQKVRATVAPSKAMIVAPSSPTATILSVGFGQCRWPYGCSGEAGFGLCGRSVARGAFCAAHAEVGYQKRSCTAESLLRMVVD